MLRKRDYQGRLSFHLFGTRDVFYVRREVDLMKTAKVNAYIMHIFGKIELLSIHATLNYFKIHYFNANQRQRHTYISHTGNIVEM